MPNAELSHFLAEVVLTSHYLAEPARRAVGELSDAEMRCLKIIASFEPIGMQDIAKRLHASKPRATQLVALLEAHSMVDRTVAEDRRRIVVAASDKGRQAIRDLDKRYDKLAAAIQSRLGEADTATLCRLLRQITPLNQLDNASEIPTSTT